LSECAYPLVARHDRAISEIYWLCIYHAVPNTWRRRALDLKGRMITVDNIHNSHSRNRLTFLHVNPAVCHMHSLHVTGNVFGLKHSFHACDVECDLYPELQVIVIMSLLTPAVST